MNLDERRFVLTEDAINYERTHSPLARSEEEDDMVDCPICAGTLELLIGNSDEEILACLFCGYQLGDEIDYDDVSDLEIEVKHVDKTNT